MEKYFCLLIASVATLLYFAVIFIFCSAEFCNITIYNIILFLFAYPLVEEYFFRGVVQKNLTKIISGRILFISCSNIITSIIFMLFHLIFSLSISSILVFIPSILLGCLYDRYGKIYVSTIFHSLFNLNIFLCYNTSFFLNFMNLL